MRHWVTVAALLIGLMLGGCGAAPVKPPPVPEPVPLPQPVEAPVQPEVAKPQPPAPREPEPEPLVKLHAAFRELAATESEGLKLRLQELLKGGRQNQHFPDLAPLAEADLDLDGKNELVVAGNDYEARTMGAGALFVFYRKDGRWEVDRSPDLPVHLRAITLYGVKEMTGGGRPEIIWSAVHVAAHSPRHSVFVTNWKPGAFANLQGDMAMINMQLRIDGTDLVLEGGGIGALSGPVQRARADRYRFVDGAFRMVDRRFKGPATAGYFRMWDGVVAEQFGRHADALQAYGEALTLPLIDPGWVQPEEGREKPSEKLMREKEQAVEAMIRFRHGALLKQLGRAEEARAVLSAYTGPFEGLTQAMLAAPTREAGCKAAEAWAKANPLFLERLTAGFWGYTAPRWTPETLCGKLPIIE